MAGSPRNSKKKKRESVYNSNKINLHYIAKVFARLPPHPYELEWLTVSALIYPKGVLSG